MDGLRTFFALTIIYVMPIVITFWLVIHSLSRLWRKFRPGLAYLAAGLCMFLVILVCVRWQSFLLGTDLGFSPIVFAIGAVIYLTSWVLWKPVKQHLNFRTFAGLPEVTNEKVELITKGPFAMVRHPRYLMVAVGVIGWCVMANYSGVYVVGLLSILGLVMIIGLEERDLVERFGDEYRAYRKVVPMLLPNPSGLRGFVSGILTRM